MSNQQYPEILINYNPLLDPIFIFYCKHNPDFKKSGWNEWVPPSKEEILRRIENYNKEWTKYSHIIVPAICNKLELKFKRNVIDVHIVAGNPRSFSHPIIMKSGYTTMEFVNTLSHELLHRLFVINNLKKEDSHVYDSHPNQPETTRNHVLIHAVLKYIFLDVLNEPERLTLAFDVSKKHSNNDYNLAWDIVEREGYLTLIEKFKKNYISKDSKTI